MHQETKYYEHVPRDFYVPPEVKYCTPCSHDPFTQGAPYRACPAAMLLLAICQKADGSQLHSLVEGLPAWVMQDFLQKGLHHALDVCELETASEFIKQGAKVNAEVIRIAQNRNKAVEFIGLAVACGWNVNSPDGCDTTLAAFVDSEPIVTSLLKNGADPNYGRPQKNTLASSTYKAEPDFSSSSPTNTSGHALDRAAATSTPAIIDMLLAAGAKPEYSAALHSAIESPRPNREQLPMIAHLIDTLGFDVDGTDRRVRGRQFNWGTPLTTAIRCGMLERATFLVLKGADPYAEEAFAGRSAAGFAEMQGKVKFVEMFARFCPVGGDAAGTGGEEGSGGGASGRRRVYQKAEGTDLMAVLLEESREEIDRMYGVRRGADGEILKKGRGMRGLDPQN